MTASLNASLYIVATPIGNLADISQRALEVLESADIIAAEDTRHSAKLLQHYHISSTLIPYHDHGDENQTNRLLEKLRAGKSIALISDAGTPLISDPGYKLVREVRSQGFSIIPIPGACALTTALCASGLPTNKFCFEGFPPAKEAARKAVFESVKGYTHTLIYYESTHRIKDSLRDMCAVFGGQREAVIARELSKTFETFNRATLDELRQQLEEDHNQCKGEFVVLIHGAEPEEIGDDISEEAKRCMQVLLAELPVKQAAALGAKLSGEKKNKLYQWALSQKEG